jgi:hypothetical protein
MSKFTINELLSLMIVPDDRLLLESDWNETIYSEQGMLEIHRLVADIRVRASS